MRKLIFFSFEKKEYFEVLLEVNYTEGFPGGTVLKNLPVNARDTRGSIPGLGRFPWRRK